MIKNYLKTIFLVFIILVSSQSNSQLLSPFKIRYQSYVKGDVKAISNNIVNRADASEFDPNVPFNNHTARSKMNDEYEMFYIDIDNDASTFCSSSANLSFENATNKKILYAGLYWSATYKFNKGILTKAGKYISTDAKRLEFNTIKLKIPGQDTYADIKGTVIYDGVDQKEVKDFSPYVVYADITDKVKTLQDASGTYTVANIKATQGMISGGVSAGWTIFVVYQDDTQTGKFITSFDGFAGVTENSTDIKFDGFQTLPNGAINAKLVCAALEGDYGLTGDQLLFKTRATNVFTPLSSTLRKPNNFFNGCITNNDVYELDRNPNSKNTLGYDSVIMTIPNPDNSVIANNSTEATLRLKSSGDRYFMFFTAYSVEVTEPDPATLLAMNKANLARLAQDKKIIASTTTQTNIVTEVIETIKKQPTIEANNIVVNTENPIVEIKKTAKEESRKDRKANAKKVLKEENTIVAVEPIKEEPKTATKEVVIKNENAIAESPKTIKAQTKKELKTDIKSDIKTDIKQEVKAKINVEKESMKDEILKGLKEEIITELKNEIVDEIKEEVKQEVKAEVKDEFKKEYKAQIKQELKNNLKEAILGTNQEVTVIQKTKKPIAIVEKQKEEPKEIATIIQEKIVEKPIEKTIIQEKETAATKPLETTSEIPTKKAGEIVYEQINTISTGYYLVANVYQSPINASKFVKELAKKKINAKSFFNLSAGLTYVYIAKSASEEEAVKLYESKLNDTYDGKMWILVVFREK